MQNAKLPPTAFSRQSRLLLDPINLEAPLKSLQFRNSNSICLLLLNNPRAQSSFGSCFTSGCFCLHGTASWLGMQSQCHKSPRKYIKNVALPELFKASSVLHWQNLYSWLCWPQGAKSIKSARNLVALRFIHHFNSFHYFFGRFPNSLTSSPLLRKQPFPRRLAIQKVHIVGLTCIWVPSGKPGNIPIVKREVNSWTSRCFSVFAWSLECHAPLLCPFYIASGQLQNMSSVLQHFALSSPLEAPQTQFHPFPCCDITWW